MPLFGGGILSLLIAILLCVHAVRTNQNVFWIFVLLFVPFLGSVVYVAAVIAPALFGGTRAKRVGMAAREALDPMREYRQAKAATEESPT
ncbi:MAG: tetratricopeptide repeat protein, partial [Caulobacteraceae bacterium]